MITDPAESSRWKSPKPIPCSSPGGPLPRHRISALEFHARLQLRREQPFLVDRERVVAVQAQWRVDAHWWDPAAHSCAFWDVELEGGQRMILGRNLVTREWFRHADPAAGLDHVE